MLPNGSLLTAVFSILLGFATITDAVSTKIGTTVELDGIYYYVPPVAVSKLTATAGQLKSAGVSGEDLVPLTVMQGDFASFNATTMESIIDRYLISDDVFSTGFLPGMLLTAARY
jgi:hypothetical protein